ncbi:MAG TPA: DUF1330 domain-containing protein [Polyangiaceae bacterium]|jgi:uncharacterized protein (DUF1330 family)|nr:DUF1330 domain-containing protein [Polyangiaceae bacterium]
MLKGYWIVRLDVTSPDAYAQYASSTPAILSAFGGRFLARGGRHEVVEGSARARNTVIEFPNYEAALACYRSPEYQAVREKRLGAAQIDIVVIEGYQG